MTRVPFLCDCDGRKISERFEQQEVSLRKPSRANAVNQLDDADAPVTASQGNRYDGLCLFFLRFLHLRQDRGVRLDIGNYFRNTALSYMANETIAHFDLMILAIFIVSGNYY